MRFYNRIVIIKLKTPSQNKLRLRYETYQPDGKMKFVSGGRWAVYMSILLSKLEICPEEKDTFCNCCVVALELGVAITDPELFTKLSSRFLGKC